MFCNRADEAGHYSSEAPGSIGDFQFFITWGRGLGLFRACVGPRLREHRISFSQGVARVRINSSSSRKKPFRIAADIAELLSEPPNRGSAKA